MKSQTMKKVSMKLFMSPIEEKMAMHRYRYILRKNIK